MIRRLGAVNELTAGASIDVAIAEGSIRVLMALAEELARIDNAAYMQFRDRIAGFLATVGDLNKQILTLSPSGEAAWRAALSSSEAQIAATEQEMVAALKAARMKRDLIAVGLTAGSILLAGWGGWYVFKKRKKKRFV